MDLSARRHSPLWSKLSLGNKIVCIFVSLLAFLAISSFFAQRWVAIRFAEEAALDRLQAAVGPFLDRLAESVAGNDSEQLDTLLEQAAGRDERLAFLIVSDLEGHPIASCVRSPKRSGLPNQVPPDDPGIDGTTRAFFSVSFPLGVEGQVLASLEAGVARADIDEVTNREVALVAALMVVPVLLVLLAARVVVKQMTKPLKKLIRVADEISLGNLDASFRFGVRVNCWEIKNCQRTECQAYQNLSEQCWYIDGTPCEGYEPRFPEKLRACRRCDVYQAHRGDEIVQLGDSFKHMTNILKASREELIKSDDFQKRLIRNSFDGIIATDASGTITIFNRQAEELTGYSREQVNGAMDWRVFFDDKLERIMDLPLSWEHFRRVRGFSPRDGAIMRQDGSLVDIRLAGVSLYEGGIHIGNVFFFQDKREMNRLREELIRSERLAATGQAAAGISHSIKNILDGLSGGVYVYKQGKRKGIEQKMETGWDMIERNVRIISSLVKDLLNFAKQRELEYEDVDPAALIEDVLGTLGITDDERINVRVSIDQPGPPVRIDVHTFHQCLGNLIRNAAEAIPAQKTGTITIRHEIAGERAVFAVSDDGVGMSPETIEKIKGGMYSTKGSKGTGLGFLVIQKIVSEHRGTITIESAEAVGSTFRIELPLNGG